MENRELLEFDTIDKRSRSTKNKVCGYAALRLYLTWENISNLSDRSWGSIVGSDGLCLRPKTPHFPKEGPGPTMRERWLL